MDDQGGELQVDDWQPDPNEPRYCLCNQVSYGDMVGCDNEDVSFLFIISKTFRHQKLSICKILNTALVQKSVGSTCMQAFSPWDDEYPDAMPCPLN